MCSMLEWDELMVFDVLESDEQAHICILRARDRNCDVAGAQLVER